MDPFTVAGSLATVMQLATYGAGFAVRMNKLLRQLGTVHEDIDYVVCDVGTSSLSITMARNVLVKYQSSHPDSEHIRFMLSKNMLVDLGNMSRKLTSRLKRSEDNLISMQSRVKLITLLKWTLRKDSILEVSSKLKNIQITMTILMNTIQLEDKNSKLEEMGRSRSREDQVEIQKLKKEM